MVGPNPSLEFYKILAIIGLPRRKRNPHNNRVALR